MENENRPPEKKELPDLSLDGPKGVGGWLAFLIIILTILSPVANIAMLAKDFHEIEMENPIMLHISAYADAESIGNLQSTTGFLCLYHRDVRTSEFCGPFLSYGK